MGKIFSLKCRMSIGFLALVNSIVVAEMKSLDFVVTPALPGLQLVRASIPFPDERFPSDVTF